MPTKYLPEADHVIRIVKPSLVMRDEANQVIGCFPQAFRLRDDERDLSVNWLEHFPGAKEERLRQVRDHAEVEVRPNTGFACINVGVIHESCADLSLEVRIIHEPTDDNPAHSAIHRYPRNHDELFIVLANIAGRDLTLARNILAG
jgi:hypothetical protein